MKQIVDIKGGDIDIYVDKQFVLHIGQVSDDNTVNLFLYPRKNGIIVESIMSQEEPGHECTHELLVERKEID